MRIQNDKVVVHIHPLTRTEMKRVYPYLTDSLLLEMIADSGLSVRNLEKYFPPSYFIENPLLNKNEYFIKPSKLTKMKFALRYDLKLPDEITVFQMPQANFAMKVEERVAKVG